jgi:enamine deaminase RidA (YjgF/YER057c/UK114 family)
MKAEQEAGQSAETFSFTIRQPRLVSSAEGPGGCQPRVRAVLDVIGRSLAAVGAQRSDAVCTKTYVTNIAVRPREGHQEYLGFFGDRLPVSTTVGLTMLADSRYLVQIEAYAGTK